MKVNFTLMIFILVFSQVYSQNPEIKTELPTVIPPSPTVAALMKFEEVSVSNYTGIPDVSIPLFTSSTHSKDININISLKYHSGVGANDRASDVGLGWSLFAGGSISRTVRGLPDEILINYNLNDTKVGLYHTDSSISNDINNYYYYKENIANTTQDYYQNNLSTQSLDIGNEFLWTAANTNKYDTEHDLWQFNFMGISGRFYIKKNLNTNLLEIIPLDDYRVKIIYNYGNVNNNPYTPLNFTIYDEKGNKYIFDVSENSNNKVASSTIYFEEDVGYSFSDNITADKAFKSAFHLSKIYDNNNNLLVNFIFNTDNYVESFNNYSINKTDIDKYEMANFNKCASYPPLESTTVSTTIIDVKKIQVIDIIGNAKIYFNYSKGRLDDNINIKEQTAYLNSIIMKDNYSKFVKQFNFEYDYSSVLNTRMLLKKVKENNESQQFITNSELFYIQNQSNGKTIGIDYWGFFNLIDNCEITTINHRNPSIEFSSTDLLEKIKYPTGGSVNFEFEPNTYAFVGDQEITNFDENNANFYLSNTSLLSFNNSIQKALPISTIENRKVKFYPSIALNEDPNQDTRSFSLLKKENGQWIQVTSLTCPFINTTCCIEFILEKNIEYAIRRNNFDLNYTGTDTMMIEYYDKNSVQKKYLYGGGNRIKNIKYLKSDNNFGTTAKIKNYTYNLFTDQSRSSGALVFPKPIYEYFDMFAFNISFFPYDWSGECYDGSDVPNIVSFLNNTSSNNLISLKTAGSDVGYSEVSVSETGLGRTDYAYSSPRNYPETNISTGIPFIPTKNFDYKRGLLQSEILYNSENKNIRETYYSYEFQNYLEHTGTRFRNPVGSCYTGSLFSTYDYYLLNLNQSDCVPCRPNYQMIKSFLCGLPLAFDTPKIIPFPIFEAYGWAKLMSKNTKNYYLSGGVTNMLETNETYTYNSLNKQIASQTSFNSLGENIKTNYYYHSGNSVHSQNRISEIEKIETFNNSTLLFTNKIDYSSTWASNQSYLPKYILTSKGANNLEEKLEYKSCDEFGHPLELRQSDGVPVSYIWGYNKTQPIAKIENATYAQVQQYEANLQTLSNGTDETALISALNALRTNLPDAMITTYTYRPLIGVSTVTDSKGDQITYSYDSFNRLQFVKDKSGNILSENQYNYKQ